ncbi:hypothetical protein SAMN05444920_12297 [Nonomuraea solani]|uniref:Uncharacterized protein n=1 Tax=Nonomuraea solani TaxID=1144553 RepID=A0A1H6EY06_9ACTN|nr:hypothetical protein [Nonomuraea solani]SEH01846.1 hypothetical protein SAMN05444920_12297 [Nonomuraea solani]
MGAGCPDIRIVVLPEDGLVHSRTPLDGPLLADLAAAADTLARARLALLDPAGAPGRDLLGGAADQVCELARRAALPPLDVSGLAPIVPNHEYFGVRTAPLDGPRLAAEVTTIAARALDDLRHARLEVNDLAAELLAVSDLLTALPGDTAGRPGGPSRKPGDGPYFPVPTELTRWIVVHHLYFLLNLRAAAAVTRAVGAVRNGDRAATLAELREATVHVRGFTAAMVHSGDMSAACYEATVRPTMRPPAVDTELTGRTQPEHRAYRRAMAALVEEFAEPYDTLAARDPELALARDALLEADLIDIERHVLVAAALVGGDRSIVQGEATEGNAVSMLRTMRHARADRYRLLMRYGDDVAAALPLLATARPGREST